MHRWTAALRALVSTAAMAAISVAPGTWAAQGKIVCWKDSSGKVIGCGDKVPPEYQNSATKELDSRGVTRRTTESAEETNQRRAREQEAARVKAEDDRRRIDQKRRSTRYLHEPPVLVEEIRPADG